MAPFAPGPSARTTLGASSVLCGVAYRFVPAAPWPFVRRKLQSGYPPIADGHWDSSPWATPSRGAVGVRASVFGGRGSVSLRVAVPASRGRGLQRMRLACSQSGCRWQPPLLCDTAQRHRSWQWTWDGSSVTSTRPGSRKRGRPAPSAPGGRRAGSGRWSWPAGLRAQSPGPSGVFPALTPLAKLAAWEVSPARVSTHSACGAAVPRPGRIPGTGHAGRRARLSRLRGWTSEGEAAARGRP